MKKLTIDYKDSNVYEAVEEAVNTIGSMYCDQYQEYEYSRFFKDLEEMLNNNKNLKDHGRCFLDVIVCNIWDCDDCFSHQNISIEEEDSTIEDDYTISSYGRVRIEFMTGREVLNSNHVHVYNYKKVS